MRKTGMRAVYSLVEKGYRLGDLIAVYHEAIKIKGMYEEEITEDYLISELENSKKEKISVISEETYNLYYEKRHDFTHPKYGLVYPISKIKKDGKVSIVLGNGRIERVYYQSLTPVVEPSKLHRMMFQAMIPMYYSKTGKMSKESIYDILRIYGQDEKLLNSLGIVLNPIFNKDGEIDTEQYKEKLIDMKEKIVDRTKNIGEDIKKGINTIKQEINIDESIKKFKNYFEFEDTLTKEPKYICIDGSLTQEEVNIFVKKLQEDLSLLELIGIIPNPNYTDSSQNTSGNKK